MGNRHGKRTPKKFEGMLPTHKWESFANSYMELCLAKDAEHEIADKLSRGYLGQRRIGPAELRNGIDQIFSAGRGGASFRAWYSTRHDLEGSTIVAASEVSPSRPAHSVERLGEVEGERDRLVARVEELNKKVREQAEELRTRPSKDADEARRLMLERNDALRKKSEAEYALKTALERAEKAESELVGLRRRPVVDEQKLAEMQASLDGKASQITRLQIRLSEVEKERDEKDIALRGAFARAQAAELRTSEQRTARVIPLQPPPMVASTSSLSAIDHLDALVREGLMTEAEAFTRLRKVSR